MNSKIAFDSASARTKDANGFLHVAACNISKETVNPYYGREIPGWEEEGLDPDKIYSGYRPGVELANGAATFNGLPLLFDHKLDSAQDPQKDLRVGSVGTDAAYVAPYLRASLSVTDSQAIEAIESGRKVELSCAYRYDPVFEPGTFEGQPYDFRMTNIRGNHVALVEEGRAGSDVVVADAQLKPNGEAAVKKNAKTLAIISGLRKRVLAMDAEIDPEKIEDILLEGLEEVQKAVEGDPNAIAQEGQDEDPKAALAAKINALQIDDAVKQELLAGIEALGKDAEPEPEPKKDPAAPAQDGGDPPAKDPDEPKKETPAMDAATIEKNVMSKVQGRLQAKDAVEAVCGKIVVDMAQDSAEGIYGKGLRLLGVDTQGHPENAFRSMFEVAAKAKTAAAAKPMAMDAHPATDDLKDTPFKHLGGIKIG